MLEKISQMWTEASARQVQVDAANAPSTLKAAMLAADKTRPPERGTMNIQRFPIDGLAKAAQRANACLVHAEADLQKAEIRLEELINEGQIVVRELHDKVQAAIKDLEAKQFALARELIESGAMERVPDLNKMLKDATARVKGETQPDDYSPTIKLEDSIA